MKRKSIAPSKSPADPISPDPVSGVRDGDLPAYVSNGLVGLRIREVPLLAGVAIVNGFAGVHPERRIEAAAYVPYPLALDIGVGEAWLSHQPWAVDDLEQAYDFSTGELTSRFSLELMGNRLLVEVITLASRSHPALVLQETTIRSAKTAAIKLRAHVDPAGVRGRGARHRTATPGEDEPVCDGSLLWISEGNLSTCGIACVSRCESAEEGKSGGDWDWRGPLNTHYCVDAAANSEVRIQQIAALVPSVIHERPDEEAVRRVAEGARLGFQELRKLNQAEWKDLWRSRIVIEGARAEHQRLVDAAFFYLNSSVHTASPAATSIFGLASWPNYHYYYGHVMWDIEAFCVPPLIFFQPDAARSLLDFRRRGMEAAKSYARLFGRDGIQFPWEAAPLSGQEATPGAGSGAAHADHVSLHVARAFSLYAEVSGDQRFAAEVAWPVLAGVADWFCSRVTWTDRGAELRAATGPAEVPNPPDNDSFSQMAAHEVLGRAVRLGQFLGHRVPATWNAARSSLYLPRRSDGVIPSHDDFRANEEKGATPSPLAGIFPYDFPLSPESERPLWSSFWPDGRSISARRCCRRFIPCGQPWPATGTCPSSCSRKGTPNTTLPGSTSVSNTAWTIRTPPFQPGRSSPTSPACFQDCFSV
ncbi:glycoside hydrolase family 65 protein [Sphingomonas sp. HDW15A]|uniref:glycoside hydrolase family 65 protein n=1 Tax=Sphingomonas sp. HDW15A TaxID=2714942 RepID=UPI0019D08C55|nr:glycoside hydrolase family 65 protein [Sphingomonas sp. HDW15A]